MATTRYPRLKLAISALSAASVIAGAAYFRSAQDAQVIQADDSAQSTVITTTYQPATAPATAAQSTPATTTTAAPSATATTAKTAKTAATTAKTSRGS